MHLAPLDHSPGQGAAMTWAGGNDVIKRLGPMAAEVALGGSDGYGDR